jgi:hypothetical protein
MNKLPPVKLKKNRDRFWILMILGVSMLMSILGSMYMMFKKSYVLSSSSNSPPAGVSLGVEGLIRQGDYGFRAYKYDFALDYYRMAETNLASMIEFESNSPSKNVSYLQHCYNTKTLLEARIKLALIAKGLSRVGQSPPDDLPPATNEPIR